MVCEMSESLDGTATLTLMGPGKSGPHKLTVPKDTPYTRQRPNPLFLLKERITFQRRRHGHVPS